MLQKIKRSKKKNSPQKKFFLQILITRMISYEYMRTLPATWELTDDFGGFSL